MQYQLPQFIEVENKIVGPFTFRQFVYLAGGAGLSYITFSLVSNLISNLFGFIAAAPVVILALMLAFYKVNQRPFIYTLEYALKYYIGSKLYLWKKDFRPAQSSAKKQENKVDGLTLPRISESKLRDMTWSLDVKRTDETNAVLLGQSAHIYDKIGADGMKLMPKEPETLTHRNAPAVQHTL